MEIVHIAAELAPVAKIGGLGDVLQGLSKAFMAKGHGVKIILPKYDVLDWDGIKNLKILLHDLDVVFQGEMCLNTVWSCLVDGIEVILIESHDKREFFNRGTIYGCPDDVIRFLYFCVAAIEYVKRIPCDVIHVHDWHSATIAGLIQHFHPDLRVKTVLTIHNLSYQGHCSRRDLESINWVDEQLREGDRYNLLKGGILYANQVTTVSPNYANELLTTEIGGPLQQTLKKIKTKFTGILNGIDYSYWNPQTDPHLPHHYSHDALENKAKIKQELKAHLSLADEEVPLVCAVTRLVSQKGPELIKAALLRTLERGGQFILLGSAPDEETNAHFHNLKRKLAGSPHIHLELTYNEQLSHLVYAAGDLLLIPSLFEPCGLTQMIAMRYGTVPLVRETGGLRDTVFDEINGFTFAPFTIEGLYGALDRALKVWHEDSPLWKQIQENGMKSDYSWNKPADEYLKIYSSFPKMT